MSNAFPFECTTRTANISSSNANQANETKNLIPVVGTDRNPETPPSWELSGFPRRLTETGEVDVGVQVEQLGDLPSALCLEHSRR
jgi:hypothetical protein